MTSGVEVCEIVLTAPNERWLADFASKLVKDRLCAAVHIFPMRTIYRWAGEIHDHGEHRAGIHTRVELVATIVERVIREHPYEVPGVAVLPLSGGNPDYLAWIVAETADQRR